MFESYNKPMVIAILLIIVGIVVFIYELIKSFAFSLTGIVSLLMGLGLVYTINASKAELNRLRLENIELRRSLEETAKSVNSML